MIYSTNLPLIRILENIFKNLIKSVKSKDSAGHCNFLLNCLSTDFTYYTNLFAKSVEGTRDRGANAMLEKYNPYITGECSGQV